MLELNKENEETCKAWFLDLSIEVIIEKLYLSCLIKEMSRRFISDSCPIWIYYLKYFILLLLLKFYVLPGQQQTWLI